MVHEQFEEAITLYAVGALDRQERQALEAHLLTGCTACRRALKDYQAVAALLPYGLPVATVPSSLTMQVMAAAGYEPARPDEVQTPVQESPTPERLIDREDRTLPASRSWGFYQTLALILILVLGGTGWYAVSQRSQLLLETAQRQRLVTALQEETARLAALQRKLTDQEQLVARLQEELTQRVGEISGMRTSLMERETELARVRTKLAQLEQETVILRRVLSQRDELVSFFRSPHVRAITLNGSEMAKSAGALLLFDPESKKTLLYAFNMPLLPAGKTYQLWAIADRPVSVGIFGVDVGRKSRLVVRRIPDLVLITKFTVTLEPAGGRPQPTGAVYLVGQP